MLDSVLQPAPVNTSTRVWRCIMSTSDDNWWGLIGGAKGAAAGNVGGLVGTLALWAIDGLVVAVLVTLKLPSAVTRS